MLETRHIAFDTLPALEGIPPVTLEEMDGVKLLNRIDSKYLTDEQTLTLILEDAREQGYRALVTEGTKIAAYDTLYFDTPGLRMFLDHHNRRLVRQKVRTRVYVGSGLTFLEIKRKNNHGRTKKKRTQIPLQEFKDFSADAAACGYLAEKSWFTAPELSPSLETIFRRITLVNPAMTERLTIDTCLGFNNFRTGLEATLRNGVIIELKQDGRADSPAKRILLKHRVKPIRVSKYCIGITLTSPGLKTNRFKVKIRKIEKQIKNKLI
ncbi:MAG: polyphosphate polymerase domain-containing protein [Bacteroidales bacterium]|nr:polyphosphate polymerase domain-containing protein [Bacteroidales bacterium]